jgi:adenosylmethionine-8-amino-7-oxononanoate aminotransferase
MASSARREVVFVRGEGCYIWDEDGRRYLDASGSLWYANVGHGRKEIAEAVVAQMAALETYHIFSDFATPPVRELAERLAGLAPENGAKVFFTSGGADSTETATKLARLYHHVRGEPARRHLISRTNGYHGTHGIATSILGMPYKAEFGPLVQETSQINWDSLDALEAEIDRLGAENVAAFIFEPVIGAGGVLPPPPGYLAGVQEICRRNGVLTIADVVICGFGRLGTWLAVERFGLTPDLITFAKGVTSGYLPLGGVIASPGVAEPFFEGEGHAFLHGATYAGHATCCAAAIANLDLLAHDGLVYRAGELEAGFYSSLTSLETHPAIGRVTGGVGLMAGIHLDGDLLAANPDAAREIFHAVRDEGILVRGTLDGLAVAPPLIIEEGDIDLMVGGIATALDRVAITA